MAEHANPEGGGGALKAAVFGIQHYSIHDGPGIRTAVFLKGCSLRCVWCHNPEGIDPLPQLAYMENRCILCGGCAALCPEVHRIEGGVHTLNRANCTGCGKCVDVCWPGALSMAGRYMSAGEVIADVMRDKAYYENSGGGLTVTGGEPMCSFAFTRELLRLAKQNGMHTALETSGCGGLSEYAELLPDLDLVLFDYKETDPQKYARFTGADRNRSMAALAFLCGKGVPIILRCPVIPGCNDTREHFEGIAAVTKQYPSILGFELLAYHRLGISKTKRLGLPDGAVFEVPSEETVKRWNGMVTDLGGRRRA